MTNENFKDSLNKGSQSRATCKVKICNSFFISRTSIEAKRRTNASVCICGIMNVFETYRSEFAIYIIQKEETELGSILYKVSQNKM